MVVVVVLVVVAMHSPHKCGQLVAVKISDLHCASILFLHPSGSGPKAVQSSLQAPQMTGHFFRTSLDGFAALQFWRSVSSVHESIVVHTPMVVVVSVVLVVVVLVVTVVVVAVTVVVDQHSLQSVGHSLNTEVAVRQFFSSPGSQPGGSAAVQSTPHRPHSRGQVF